MNVEFGVDEEDLRKHEGSHVLHSFSLTLWCIVIDVLNARPQLFNRRRPLSRL